MKTFLKIDYFIQTLLLIGIGITIPFVFVPLLILAVFGGWQLLSGIITAVSYPQLKRHNYLFKSISYVLFLYGTHWLAEAELLPEFLKMEELGFIFFWVILPAAIGIWYYRMVSKDYRLYCKEKGQIVLPQK